MSLIISQDEISSFCTAIALISGGYQRQESVFAETERLFGSGGLISMKNLLDRYCDGFTSVLSLNSRGNFVVNVKEILLPEYRIEKHPNDDFPDIIE
jgi:hypothetical protein